MHCVLSNAYLLYPVLFHYLFLPPLGLGDILFFPVRLSVHLSDCPSQNLVNPTPYYSFSWVFLKLCRCFCQGLEMTHGVWLYPQIDFVTFFCSSGLVFFGLKAFRHWVSCECNSSYSFSWIFLKHCRCFCPCLKMCMMVGCNSQNNFCLQLQSFCDLKHLDTVNATAPTVFAGSF